MEISNKIVEILSKFEIQMSDEKEISNKLSKSNWKFKYRLQISINIVESTFPIKLSKINLKKLSNEIPNLTVNFKFQV